MNLLIEKYKSLKQINFDKWVKSLKQIHFDKWVNPMIQMSLH